MLCCRVFRRVFKISMLLALPIALLGCDTLHGLPHEMYYLNREGWPAPYKSAADDARRNNCAGFANKMLPLISIGDNEATYLMSQAMRRGLYFGKKKLEYNKPTIDDRQANLDLLVFYSALPDYEGRYALFKEYRRERYELIDDLLSALSDTIPTENIKICYRDSRSPQQCYQDMVDKKIIPSLPQRVAELQRSIDAGYLVARCLTSYSKIDIPY